jgi:hypothetical protein
MDLQSLSLPDWLPWWAIIALLVPVAFYMALFLLMPFSTFGLRARLRDMELRIDALHEEIRALTLRLPERAGPSADDSYLRQPPIPPASREFGPRDPAARDVARDHPAREEAPREAAPRGTLGDPVADRMLAYMRDKAQSEFQRGDARPQRARQDPRAEPRFAPARPPEPPLREPQPPHVPLAAPLPPEGAPPPLPPRVPNRFGRRPADSDPGDSPADWPR